ncbi:tRNA adenosine(34) deaminase TadA [Metallibacterium sp.]|jgi:tRNA(Arg) A34 adenosine deaminase TadA|uniref:tRNA adenosine(34) deaminase TadA n=1 Tax=Metallibacterium sp. TaxID=2940281 RepID=UPI00261F30F1|nr:tRNA adenosine(34) deaminase TadA [Metallibacterium sp.]
MGSEIHELPNCEWSAEDQRWMLHALELAQHADQQLGEVPVGAALIQNGQLIGAGCNRSIIEHDPSAHAEIVALRAAGQLLGNYRYTGSTLYVTLEPCAMCAMALIHARVARVVYAAADLKTGAAGSVFDTLISAHHNHRVEVRQGLLADASAELLREFFRRRR